MESFYSKNFFFLIVEWNSGVNVQHTKITPVSFWELHIPSCSKLIQQVSARSVPLCQRHQVGVHLGLCQNPGEREKTWGGWNEPELQPFINRWIRWPTGNEGCVSGKMLSASPYAVGICDEHFHCFIDFFKGWTINGLIQKNLTDWAAALTRTQVREKSENTPHLLTFICTYFTRYVYFVCNILFI